MHWRRGTRAIGVAALSAVTVTVTIGVGGCGRSRPASEVTTTVARAAAAPCLPAVAAALRGQVGGPVRLTAQVAVPEVLTCAYSAVVRPSKACGTVKVVVDTDPQPYTDFSRWEVEAGQVAAQDGKHDEAMYPVLVGGIGIAADWVPMTHELDGVSTSRWVRVFLSCPGGVSGLPQAEAVVRLALVAPLP